MCFKPLKSVPAFNTKSLTLTTFIFDVLALSVLLNIYYDFSYKINLLSVRNHRIQCFFGCIITETAVGI